MISSRGAIGLEGGGGGGIFGRGLVDWDKDGGDGGGCSNGNGREGGGDGIACRLGDEDLVEVYVDEHGRGDVSKSLLESSK